MAANRDALPAGLLDDVKNMLDITWNDAGTDEKLKNMIASGISYIDAKAGNAADYTADGPPRSLLFEYVRYFRDGGLDVFENNYLSLLLDLQLENQLYGN